MNKRNPFLGNFENAQEEFKKIQEHQSSRVSNFLKNGMALQKKQYELMTNLVQNQIEFGNSFFSEALSTINDNVHAAIKEQKNK